MRFVGLTEPSEAVWEWVRAYELREGRLEALEPTDNRCWLAGRDMSWAELVVVEFGKGPRWRRKANEPLQQSWREERRWESEGGAEGEEDAVVD